MFDANVIITLMALDTNIEYITPISIIVFVESEKSSLYARPRIIKSDMNANSIAITIVPANGSEGNDMPNAMAITAPRLAPEDTPSVEPSASGFFKRPCIAAPQSESDAPVSATHSTRGSRTVSIIDAGSSFGMSSPSIARRNISAVLFSGTFTLPKHTQATAVNMAAAANIMYSYTLKPSCVPFISVLYHQYPIIPNKKPLPQQLSPREQYLAVYAAYSAVTKS